MKFEQNWHHEAISHELNRLMAGETRNLIINVPPRSLKSFLVDCEEPEKARSGGDKCVNLGAGFCQETRFLGSIPGKIKFGIHTNRKL